MAEPRGAAQTDSPLWNSVAASIGRALGCSFMLEYIGAVGGGCINRGHYIRGSGREFFVKLNSARHAAMFEAEADGLAEIAATRTVRVPLPLCFDNNQCHA